MRKIWFVCKRELIEIIRSPFNFVWMLGVPIILVATIGNIFNFGPNSPQDLKIKVAVVSEEKTQSARQFVDGLRAISILVVSETDLNTAKDSLDNKREISAYVVVPAGFEKSLQSGQTVTINARIDPSDSAMNQTIKGVLQNYAARYNTFGLLQAASQAQAGRNGSNPLSPEELAKLQASQQPAMNVMTENAGARNLSTFDQIAPGYATMFVMIGLTMVTEAVFQDRQRGTLRRLASLPLPKYAYMGGKMLAQFIISFVQVSAMFLFAWIFFHINLNLDNLPGIFLVAVGLSFAATGLGMLIASVCKTETQARPIVILVALIGSAVGGSWFPLFLMPEWVQTFSKVTINSWAMDGFNNLMIFNANLSQVLLNIVVLMGYGLVCLLLAMKLFKYRAV